MDTNNEDGTQIRKYRKKLRQIERLELLDRDLTEEEEVKIDNKAAVRNALQELLSRTESASASESCWTQQATTRADVQNTSADSALGDQFSNSEILLDTSDADDEGGEGSNSDAESLNIGFSHDDPGIETNNGETNQASDHQISTKRESVPTKEDNSQPVPAKKAKGGAHSDGSKKKEVTKEVKEQNVQQLWRRFRFDVTGLEGHSDLVCCISILDDLLLTGSRDTTVKLWNLKTLLEIRSMGGHTGGVNKVVLLSKDQSEAIGGSFQNMENEGEISQLALSGAQDCSIKIWDIMSGRTIHSIYTFSPVTGLTTVQIPHTVILYATSGGKIELWDPRTESVTQSLHCHEGAITGLVMEDNYLYTSGEDGLVKVHQLRDSTFHTVFESENVKGINGATVHPRKIHSLAVFAKLAYFGDDGTNMKALDWTNGVLHKLSNHTIEFGSTNALCVNDGIIISSGYDLDNGIGYMNVRHLPSEKYLCSLCDEDTSRIVCLGCTRSDGRYLLVTGGMELVVWKQFSANPSSEDAYLLESQHITAFDRPARNSDVETEGEASDSDMDLPADVPSFPRRRSSQGSLQNAGWFSRCSIL